MNHSDSHKNPSREQCENIIRRILVTEVQEKGCNAQFKQASDFMNYFQSLYPASDALTKQVQRAIKTMNLPKDEYGYYIVNKTSTQLEQEQELKYLFQKSSAAIDSLENCETVFLRADEPVRAHLIYALSHSVTFEHHFETVLETSNGILFYTKDKDAFLTCLKSLMDSSIDRK